MPSLPLGRVVGLRLMVLVVGKVIERGLGWGELVTPLLVVVRGEASKLCCGDGGACREYSRVRE